MENFILLLIAVAAAAAVFLFYRSESRHLQRGKAALTRSKLPPSVVEEVYDAVVEKVANGEIAHQFPSNVLLKRGERLIIDIPSIQLCEERAVRGKAAWHGVSIRIMKGVSYRVGTGIGGLRRR